MILIYLFLICSYLIYLSIIDIKTLYIKDSQILILGLISLPLWEIQKIFISILIIIILVFLKLIKKNWIGSADIKIFGILSNFLGYLMMPTMFIASFGGIVFLKVFKNQTKEIPFVPFITLGVIVCLILQNLIIV